MTLRKLLLDVSPDVATRMLAASTKRNVNMRRVGRLARLMRAEWVPEVHRDEPVLLLEGRLRDGNHRLTAVIHSGLTVPMYVETDEL